MVVVDTNVLVYLLIAGDRTQEVQSLYEQDADWISEGLLLIEFSNSLATYQRSAGPTGNQAESLLNEAEKRVGRLIAIPHISALQIAQRFSVSAYDARFLAVAEKLRTTLVSEDTKLRSLAPSLTRSLNDVLSEG